MPSAQQHPPAESTPASPSKRKAASANDTPAPVAASSPAARGWVTRVLALGIAALILFPVLGKSGIWDPYELDAADLSRRIAIQVFGAHKLELPGVSNTMPTLTDLRMGELPFTSMAVGFRLFGLHDWSGRLPLGVWALAGAWVLYELLARLVDRRAGLYAVIALVTMPLFFLQARTMLGDIVTMSSLSIAFCGLTGALLDDGWSPGVGSAPVSSHRPAAVRIVWFGIGLVGLVAGFLSRGWLIGAAVPALAVGLTWVLLQISAPRAPRGLGDLFGLLTLVLGVATAWAGIRLMLRATPDAPMLRGLAMLITKKAGTDATFDLTVRRLGHALIPWSALLPFIVGRIFRAPVEVAEPARRREAGLRVALLMGACIAYAVFAYIAPHTGALAFSAPALLAGIAAVAIFDFERGAPPSRTLGLGCFLLAFVLYRDLVSTPDKAFAAFSVDKASFPKSFEPAAATAMRVVFSAFAAVVALSWFEPQQPDRSPWPAIRRQLKSYPRDLAQLPKKLGRKALVAIGAVELVLVLIVVMAGNPAGSLADRLPRIVTRYAMHAACTLPVLVALVPLMDALGRSWYRWLTAAIAGQRARGVELSRVWNGNLLFALIVIEAGLVGLGAMLFVGRFANWVAVQRLPRNFADLFVNLWWQFPLALLLSPILAEAVRDLFRFVVALSRQHRAAFTLLAALLAGGALSFWYYPALAAQISPKEVFESYSRLRKPGEPLGMIGVRSRAISYYHEGGDVLSLDDSARAFGWLTDTSDQRRWLIAKADDLPRLNSLHRQKAGKNLPVLDGQSSQILLISNQLAGRPNENWLAKIVLDDPPQPMHPLDVMFEDQLAAVGWEVTGGDGRALSSVVPQTSYHIRFYYRVHKPITGNWKVFLHIDGFQRRYNGDHTVLDGKYAMNLWQPGDVIVDDYEFALEPNFTPGSYIVYFGFFAGETRFKVTRGPHQDNRVDAGALIVR